ncbi:hypothetical protein D9M68_758460 [compost metagenome]
MIDDAAGRADRVDELEHRTAGCRQVLDDENACAFRHVPFDLGVAAVALRRLADIDHRQAQALGEHGREGNAGRFAAGNHVEFLETGLTQDRGCGKIHHSRTDARVGNQLAAVDIDGARHAGRQLVGLIGTEVYSLDLPEHLGDQLSHNGLVGERVGKHQTLLQNSTAPRVFSDAQRSL